MDWLEAIRRHVEQQLGEQVTKVLSGGDIGLHIIGICMPNGWRYAVVVQPGDMPEAVAAALQKAIDERRKSKVTPARKVMRRIIQIATTFDSGDGVGLQSSSYKPAHVIVALCDDGTLWQRFFGQDGWDRIEAIPQEDT